MIDILYFASLRENLGQSREQLELPSSVNDIEQLKKILAQRDDNWQQVFAGDFPLMCAVNQNMANDQAAVSDGDEVAFFPPVTGG